MKHTQSSFTLALAAFVGFTGASPNGTGIADGCSSSVKIFSDIVMINGQEILHQTFACLNGTFAGDLQPEPGANGLVRHESRSTLAARDEILCDFPQFMAECQCGTMFNCQCFQGDVAPGVFDCLDLVNSVTSANEGTPAFIVQPNQLEVLTLRTCSLSFANLQNVVVEYCWDNLNFIGMEAWDRCVSDESDRVVGAVCDPANGQYRITLGPIVAV